MHVHLPKVQLNFIYQSYLINVKVTRAKLTCFVRANRATIFLIANELASWQHNTRVVGL